MYWVTMTDKFFSHVEGTTSKLVIECETYDEAVIVEENANNRSEMIHVNIRSTKPYYPYYNVYWHDKEDYPSWFKAGYF